MARIYLDSNVFFYAKIMDRIFGKPCATILKSALAGEIKGCISTLVPLEVANAMMKYGLAGDTPDEIRAIFSLGLELFPIEGTDAREVAEAVEQSGVSPYDCTHAVLMKRYSVREIVSADKDFDRFSWVKRIDPRFFRTKSED